jgi:GAF domain-containing protein/HAMP domain-containing protein
MHNSIRRRLILISVGLAIVPLLVVGSIIALQIFTTLRQQSLMLQQETARRANSQVTAFFQELENELHFTIQLGKLDQNPSSVLSDLLAYQPAFDELHLLNKYGQEQVGVYRLSLATTQVDRSNADEFVIPKTTGQVYYGPAFYDDTTNEPLMIIGVPVVNLRTGSVDRVLVAVTRIKKVWDLIAGMEVSQGQSVYIVDAQGKVVAHRNPSVVLRDTHFNLPEQSGIQPGLNGASTILAFNTMSLGQQQLNVVAEQTLVEAMAPALNVLYVGLVVFLLVAGLAVVLGLLSVRRIVQPIQELAKTVEGIGAGDLTSQVQVTTNDEIGTLATAFNSMTTRLRDLIGTLEQRVVDRTKALATSSEVSRRLSTIINQKELVIEVVEQVKEAFGYYHAHIYLLEGDELVMAGGTGDAGAAMLADGHKLPKGRGLVGRAAEGNEPVLVPDTSQDPNWLPNPLLPETKSEVAIPISIGNQVLGVLDVQHDITDGLGQEDVDALQSIANQVAGAIQNINQYEKTQKLAADLGVVANVGIVTSTITEADHLLQEVVDLSKQSFGLYHAHIYLLNESGDTLELASGAGVVGRQMVAERRAIPLDSEKSLVARAARDREGVVVNDVRTDPDFLPNPLLPETRAEMAVPMLVSGKVIGVLDVQSEQVNRFSDTDVNIQTTLASQVAVALQNARSLAAAQKQAERETTLNTIAQKIQGTATIEEAMQIAARELGHALGKRQTLVALDAVALAGDGKGVVAE